MVFEFVTIKPAMSAESEITFAARGLMPVPTKDDYTIARTPTKEEIDDQLRITATTEDDGIELEKSAENESPVDERNPTESKGKEKVKLAQPLVKGKQDSELRIGAEKETVVQHTTSGKDHTRKTEESRVEKRLKELGSKILLEDEREYEGWELEYMSRFPRLGRGYEMYAASVAASEAGTDKW